MREKEVKNEIYKIQKRTHKLSRKCMYPDCSQKAIKSHLLQKNGIINQIAENKHVMEVIGSPFTESQQIFKKTGHQGIFTFPGFCDTHDNILFKPIEEKVIDFDSYESQLLFSYRASVNERSKKEIIIDTNVRILSSPKLNGKLPIDYMHYLNDAILGLTAGIKDSLIDENKLLTNITDNKKKDFTFITRRLPRYEICSSGIFTYETSNELINTGHQLNQPLTEIYFNLLPCGNEMILIIGCQKNSISTCHEYLQQFKNKEVPMVLKLISNILLCQIENWTTSISFYDKYLKSRSSVILKTMLDSVHHKDERRDLSINIFNTT